MRNSWWMQQRGTIAMTAFVAAFVFAAGTSIGGPGSGSGGGFFPNSDCTDPVFDTACGKELANEQPENPCLCAEAGSALPGELDLSFEVNAGQAPPGVRFVARPGGLSIELGSNGTVYRLRKGREITVRLAGAKEPAEWKGLEPLPGRTNYLLGNDPKYWHTGIATYRKVSASNVYPGVEVLFYGKGSVLEHDFRVEPNADASRIRYEFVGVEQKTIDARGDLILRSGAEEIRWKTPIVYQQSGRTRLAVAGRYRQHPDGSIGFELGNYDRTKPLVIDPVVLYASYLGRGTAELAHKAAVDGQGNMYLVGQTVDAEFPTSAGVFKSGPGATDKPNITITKLRADGSGVVYSTYIGGQDADMPGGVQVDNAGNVYVAGYTGSLNFPITPGAAQRSPGNPDNNRNTLGDCFVLKLNASGSDLAYSTFLGGTAPDTCTALTVDASGNAYVAGTTSSNLPGPQEGAFQRLPRAGNSRYDGFVAKLDASGSRWLGATLFGGNGMDVPTAVAADRNGNAYVAGFTNSNVSFPVSADAYQSRLATDSAVWRSNRRDGFLLKFNPDFTSLLYGTYLGGSKDDLGLAMTLDSSGNVILAGSTTSADFPVTTSAFQGSYKGEGGAGYMTAGDGFVATLRADGRALIYSTYLGGSLDDRVLGVSLDSAGNLWLTGNTLSADFPISNDAGQTRLGGSEREGMHLGDAFVTQLAANGRMLYSTFLGGSGEDVGIGIAAIPRDNTVLVAGGTTSVNFASSANAVQRNFGGASRSYLPLGDMFLVRIGDPPRPAVSISGVANLASGGGGAVAPGEMVIIGGVNIGPATAVAAPEGPDLPTMLGEARVWFDDVAAPLLSSSATQLVAVVPYSLAGRATKVVVEYRGDRSAALEIPVVAAMPGLFTTDQSGKGLARVLAPDGTPLDAIQPGSIITLFGTGAGITDPPSIDGRIAEEDFPPLASAVSVTIGGVPVQEIFFSGGVKGRPAGMFQIQFRVPEGVEPGEQPVVARIGDANTQDGVFVIVNE